MREFGPMRRMAKRSGVQEVYAPPKSHFTEYGESDWKSAERKLVAEWPPERIANLHVQCQIPTSRLLALLGIGSAALTRLQHGDFTPGWRLCKKMAELEAAAERGDLHHEYIPHKSEMRRRMAGFRTWYMNKPLSAEFPLLTVTVQIVWGKAAYQKLTLPLKFFPALRIMKWEAVAGAMKALTVAMRKFAGVNGSEIWKKAEQEYWDLYSKNQLPKEVVEKARIGNKR
jgi:hypothetical protein